VERLLLAGPDADDGLDANATVAVGAQEPGGCQLDDLHLPQGLEPGGIDLTAAPVGEHVPAVARGQLGLQVLLHLGRALLHELGPAPMQGAKGDRGDDHGGRDASALQVPTGGSDRHAPSRPEAHASPRGCRSYSIRGGL